MSVRGLREILEEEASEFDDLATRLVTTFEEFWHNSSKDPLRSLFETLEFYLPLYYDKVKEITVRVVKRLEKEGYSRKEIREAAEKEGIWFV